MWPEMGRFPVQTDICLSSGLGLCLLPYLILGRRNEKVANLTTKITQGVLDRFETRRQLAHLVSRRSRQPRSPNSLHHSVPDVVGDTSRSFGKCPHLQGLKFVFRQAEYYGVGSTFKHS